MKLNLTILLCIVLNIQAFAQNVITRDTINLIGRILTSDGNPASDVIITSKQKDTRFENFPIADVSNKDGVFFLNGIMPNDTLRIISTKYQKLQYYNNGSRTMVIILPQETAIDITMDNAIEISATRTTPKVTASIMIPTNPTKQYFIIMRPEFPGGNDKFPLYIKKQLTYPQKAADNNIEGTVQVSCTVQKDGSLNDFFILKGLGYGCDEEVVKILSTGPKFMPGIVNGAKVTAQISVSVKFSLKDK